MVLGRRRVVSSCGSNSLAAMDVEDQGASQPLDWLDPSLVIDNDLETQGYECMVSRYLSEKPCNLGPHLQDVSSLKSLQTHVYDPLNCSPVRLESRTDPDMEPEIQQRIERGEFTLTNQQVQFLVDQSSPRGSENFSRIEKLFCEILARFLEEQQYDNNGKPTHGRHDVNEVMQRLQLETIYNEYNHGSCLFRCLDYCLNGNYAFASNCSATEREIVTYHYVNNIKKQFVVEILSRVGSARTPTDAATIMQQVINTQDFEVRHGNKYAKMTCDQFVQQVNRSCDGYDQLELIRIWESKQFIVDVSCHVDYFANFMNSNEEGTTILSPTELVLLKSRGINGLFLPPGYFSRYHEGSSYEISLIPTVLCRQVILVDVDTVLQGAGMGMKTEQHGKPLFIKPGVLGTPMATSVYGDRNTSFLQKDGICAKEPMLLMRYGHHYMVCRTLDNGNALHHYMWVRALYAYVTDIHMHRREFMINVLKVNRYNNVSPEDFGKLFRSVANQNQCDILLFTAYEIARYQIAFCKAFLLPIMGHSQRFCAHFTERICQIMAKCKFVNPGTLLETKTLSAQ